MSLMNVIPSHTAPFAVRVVTGETPDVDAIAIPISIDGLFPEVPGIDAATLSAAGFEATLGATLVIPTSPVTLVATGFGTIDALNIARVRDAAAAFANVTLKARRLAVRVSHVQNL